MFHLVFNHGAEVVIPEKDAEFSLLHGGCELTQAVVRQLSGRAAQELLCHNACHTQVQKKRIAIAGRVECNDSACL